MEQKFNKWNNWLDIIYDQIMNISTDRYIFHEIQTIIKNNHRIQKPSAFYDFISISFETIGLKTLDVFETFV